MLINMVIGIGGDFPNMLVSVFNFFSLSFLIFGNFDLKSLYDDLMVVLKKFRSFEMWKELQIKMDELFET